jgi:hypothetical protein
MRLVDRQAAIETTWKDPTYTDPLNVLTEVRDRLEALPVIEEEKWVQEIREAYERAKANPYIRKPLSRAMYEVWHRYDQTEVERR